MLHFRAAHATFLYLAAKQARRRCYDDIRCVNQDERGNLFVSSRAEAAISFAARSRRATPNFRTAITIRMRMLHSELIPDGVVARRPRLRPNRRIPNPFSTALRSRSPRDALPDRVADIDSRLPMSPRQLLTGHDLPRPRRAGVYSCSAGLPARTHRRVSAFFVGSSRTSPCAATVDHLIQRSEFLTSTALSAESPRHAHTCSSSRPGAMLRAWSGQRLLRRLDAAARRLMAIAS